MNASTSMESVWETEVERQKVQTKLLLRTLSLTVFGLLLTSAVAYWCWTSGLVQEIGAAFYFPVLFLEVAVALAWTFLMRRANILLLSILYITYTSLTGFTMSVILSGYSSSNVAIPLLMTAGVFAAMSLYGWLTKKPLDQLATVGVGLLLGFLLLTFLNLFFMKLPWISLLIDYGVLAVFMGLTAYEIQRIKRVANQIFEAHQRGQWAEKVYEQTLRREALCSALTLYLDLVNIFLRILSIRGRR